MRRWFATVRVRTTVFATLVVTAALVAGAILLLVVQQRALVAGLEQSIRNRATDVAALAKRGDAADGADRGARRTTRSPRSSTPTGRCSPRARTSAARAGS